MGPLDYGGDEQEEVLGMQMSDAEEVEQELINQMKMDGFPQFKEERRRERLTLPRETRASVRSVTMIGHKPEAVMFRP